MVIPEKLVTTIHVLRSGEVIAELVGREITPEHLNMADMGRVIDVEQYLERLTGLRFHIHVSVGENGHG